MAQVLEFLPYWWETQIKFQAPCLGMDYTWLGCNNQQKKLEWVKAS